MRALSTLHSVSALVLLAVTAGCHPDPPGGNPAGMGGMGGNGGAAGAMVTDPGPVCSRVCGPHARCVTAGNAASCICVAGYYPSAGGCMWGSLLQDPGFEDMPSGAWTVSQGAALAPRANGPLDPGELQLDMTAICSGGTARQTITTPSVADSDPLALRMNRTDDCWGAGGTSCSGPATAVTINGATTLFEATTLSRATMACLGERAYGGTYDVVVGAGDRSNCALGQTVDMVVDHLDIEPSAACPVPGTLPDGDFEDAGTWTASMPPNASAGTPPVAELLPGAGTDGSRAAHVSIGAPCDFAQLQALISPPLTSVPNLAVQLAFLGTGGARLGLSLNGVVLGSFAAGDAGWTTARSCVPEGLKGTTVKAAIGILDPASYGTVCPQVTGAFVFDDVQFVSDPSCPTTAWLLDGDFERPGAETEVQTSVDSQGHGDAQVYAGLDDAPDHAFSGAHALKLSNGRGSTSAVATFPISIPPAAPGAGPALAFAYKAPVLSSSSLKIQVASAASVRITSPAADYAPVQICLDRTAGGQTGTVTIKLAGNGTDDATYAPETVWLDQFAVVTSAACPTN